MAKEQRDNVGMGPYTGKDGEYLPSHEELEYPVLKMTSAALVAGAHHFGKYCDNLSKEYMLCEQEERDPRRCLKEGRAVTQCGFEFFGKVKEHCFEDFTRYWKCLDYARGGMFELNRCRKQQALFDKCMVEKLGQKRPELGHFAKMRVHHTERSKPTRPEIAYPKPSIDIPDYASMPFPDTVKFEKGMFGGYIGE